MDEGRRNFLTYQIISGIKIISIDDIKYRLIAPSKEIRFLAEHIYQETVQSLRFDNLITKEKSKLFLIGLGIWGDAHREDLEKLEKHIEDKKISLYKSLYDSDKQKRIRKTLNTAKKSLNNALIKKHSLDYMTLDYHAHLTKNKFITGMCLLDNKGNHVYDEESFWHADSTILEKVINFLDNDTISIEEFRGIARNDPWRTLWNLGKESCMGVPPVEWTDDQKTLVTFAKMYDNAYQSMECPPDEVFEDDDMFDGWLIDQRRKREKDQKQKQVDSIKSVPDKAQEVFLYAPTREDADNVYDLNDADARMKIKQRQRMIENHDGMIEAQHLPDTQLELRRQQMNEFKSKMKGGR